MKRIGRKTLTARQPIADVGVPSCSIEEAVEIVMKIKRAKNLKDRTIDGYVKDMRNFIDWVEERRGKLAVADVTPDLIREYVIWCRDEKTYYEGHPFKSEYAKDRQGLAPSSVNVRIRTLRTVFATLAAEGIIDANPAKNVSLMRQDVDTVEPLTEDELRRFMQALDKNRWAQWRDYVIIILLLDSGMRLNEICELEKSEIDFTRKQITLPASKNKNRKSRLLPLSSETLRLLKQLIAETAHHFDTPYVFTTNYGEQLSEKTIQKAFDKYAEKAKLGRNVSPHVLRHNFATMAAEDGISVFHLQKLMGHADIATTRKYVQLSAESITSAHGRFTPLGRILGRGKSKR